MVYGIVADYMAGNIDGITGSTATYGCAGGAGCFTNVDSIMTVRGRIGVTRGNALMFASAGVAQVRGAGGLDGVSNATFSGTTGAIGLGVEAMVGRRTSIVGEVVHTLPFGPINTGGGCVAPGCQIDRISTTTVRLGLNFHF